MESYQFESIKERMDIQIQQLNKIIEILEKGKKDATTTTSTAAV